MADIGGFGNRVAAIAADEMERNVGEFGALMRKLAEEARAYADAGANPPYCVCWKENPDCEWCVAYRDWLEQDEAWRQEWRDQFAVDKPNR